METPLYRLQTTTKLLEDLKYSSPLIFLYFNVFTITWTILSLLITQNNLFPAGCFPLKWLCANQAGLGHILFKTVFLVNHSRPQSPRPF